MLIACPPDVPRSINRRPAGLKPGVATASGPQRLQKVLAAAGLGSRRQCEELITVGRVEVDRRVVTELARGSIPSQQFASTACRWWLPKLVYYAVNKPAGVLSTNRDPSGRPRVIDLSRQTPGCLPSAGSTCTARG